MEQRVDGYRTALGVMDMIRMLEESPDRACPVNKLAERLGVDRRTIRRWSTSLETQLDAEDGSPRVMLVRGVAGREAIVRLAGQRTPATTSQLRAAALALAATRFLASTGAEPLEAMAERLIVRQAGHDREAVRRMNTAIHYIPFGGKTYVSKAEEVDAVFFAVISRMTIAFDYWLVEHQRSVRVRAEPYSLVIYRDALYMLGRRLGVGEPVMRVYTIDRMSDPEVDRQARFEVPAGFNPSEAFGDLGLWKPDRPRERLEIVFEAKAARFVRERQWPGFVAWLTEADGRARLVLEILVSKEVEQWVLGFGADAEVIAPAWLREAMGEQAARMSQRYGRDATVRG